MQNSEKYIFAGGGTGGHLYPAIAIAVRLQQLHPDCEIHFVGTSRGIESRVVPELNFPLHLISVRGLVRSFTLKNVLVPFMLMWSVLQCAVLLLKIRPVAVIGTGGYVSGPVLFVAGFLRFPTIIQEQNSYPGATTRLLSMFVTRVHLSFEESKKYFKNKKKLVVSGNPVRQFDLSMDKSKAREKLGLSPDRPTLLVTGGSQGAHAINEALLGCLDQLMAETSLQLIWSTGKGDVEHVQKITKSFGARIFAAAFISNMEEAYAAADLAMARAGALSLAEITLCGLPSVLIPYPFAAANHQQTNAESLRQSGAAVVIRQDELTPELLLAALKELLSNPEKMAAMKKAAANAAFPKATDDLVRSIFKTAKIENPGDGYESKN